MPDQFSIFHWHDDTFDLPNKLCDTFIKNGHLPQPSIHFIEEIQVEVHHIGQSNEIMKTILEQLSK